LDFVADIGNTRAHLAAFESGVIVARAAVRGGRPAPEVESDLEPFAASLKGPVARAAIASVNPKMTALLARWVRERLGIDPLIVGETLRPKIALEVDAPERVGADRLMNALWAARTFPGRAVVVVDFGTAISFSVVSPKGAFVGGAIAPGLGTQARALAERTAQLPLVQVSSLPRAIGQNTAAAIDSGIYWGAVGLVEALASRMEPLLGERPLVIATGGDAPLVAAGSARIERVAPDMTLEGVHLALLEASAP
jgi:type III pantothenate kinase